MVSREILEFSVSVVVCKKYTEVISRITIVYGPAYEESKQEFISELHSIFLN